MDYKPKEYWENRLKRDFSLSGTGHSGFSLKYNRYMYKLRSRKLNQAVTRNNINIKGSDILDIGSGTGFFVEYYLSRGAKSVTGIDVADISVKRLSEKFPAGHFYKMDISKGQYLNTNKFDIINAFDVLYHIIDDSGFKSAVGNIALAAKQKAWVFITDALRPELSAASHVRYRSLGDYRRVLQEEGIDIIESSGIFNFLGRSRVQNFNNSILEGIMARLIESTCLFAYLADSIYCPLKASTINLLICRKR